MAFDFNFENLCYRTAMNRPLEFEEVDENIRIVVEAIMSIPDLRDYEIVAITFRDGKMYATRKNGTEIGPFTVPSGIPEAPLTANVVFGRSGGQWVPVSVSFPAAGDGVTYGFRDGQWVPISTGGISHGPSDNKIRGSLDGEWAVIPTHPPAAGPVGRETVRTYREGPSPASGIVKRFTLPDGYVHPPSWNGTRFGSSKTDYAVELYATMGAFNPGTDTYIGRVFFQGGSASLERNPFEDGVPNELPAPIPAGSILYLHVSDALGANDWLMLDIPFDPASAYPAPDPA